MPSFTSLPGEFKSKIIEHLILSTTETMAKEVDPISANHLGNMMVRCQETFLSLASVSGSFVKELIHTCYIHGYTSVITGSAHAEDQVFMLQYLRTWYSTFMCNAYMLEELEGTPPPAYWAYHREYVPEPKEVVVVPVIWEPVEPWYVDDDGEVVYWLEVKKDVAVV